MKASWRETVAMAGIPSLTTELWHAPLPGATSSEVVRNPTTVDWSVNPIGRAHMDLLTRTELESLAHTGSEGQHVSLLMPTRTFRVPAPMVELAAVGSRTVMGPMLRLFAGDERFLVLALSQREIRLMEGSRNVLEQVQLTDVPTSLKDAVDPQEPRSNTMARRAANAGRVGPAVFYGHGAGDRHLKKDELLRFLRQVSNGLRYVLAGETALMVLFGLDPLIVTYREVNAFEHLLDAAVVHDADQLSIE
jgi:hypothetical protein